MKQLSVFFIKAKIVYLKIKAKQSFKDLQNEKASTRQSHILGGADSVLESLVQRDTSVSQNNFTEKMNKIRKQKEKLK